LTTKA
jgi:hypothetical protein